MRRTFFASPLAVILTVFFVPQALAWNGEAHQLVAWIAEERLSDKAKASVRDLLDGASLSDAEIAGLPDQVRRERRESAPWHYINIPISADGYDAKRDSNNGDNVIAVVERFALVLADRTAPREQRVEALKFVAHVIGDMHQPLHVGDRGDKGGNTRLVFLPDRRKAINPHTVWDTHTLPRNRGNDRCRIRRGAQCPDR